MIGTSRTAILFILVLLQGLFSEYISAQSITRPHIKIPRNSQEEFFQGYWTYENPEEDELFIVKIKPFSNNPYNTYYKSGVHNVVGSYLYKKGDILLSDNLSRLDSAAIIGGLATTVRSFIEARFYDYTKRHDKGYLRLDVISTVEGDERLFWLLNLPDYYTEDLSEEELKQWRNPFSVPTNVVLDKVSDLSRFNSRGIFLESFAKEEHRLDPDFSIAGNLPVDLAKYNRLLQDKPSSPEPEVFSLCLDSLVDYSQCKHVFFEKSGWAYNQYSFKSNKAGLYGALLIDHRNYLDSLVSIKCFYLEVSRQKTRQKSEYVVSLVPTKAYADRHPDFDFLDKPGFSGVILYSSKEGKLQKVETVINGLILGSGLLDRDKETPSELPQATSKSYFGCVVCGAQPVSANGFCSDCEASFLKSLVIAGPGKQSVVEEVWATVIHQAGF